METTYDAIVVGAGYIGCSAAYYLTQAGLKTALIDKGGVAAGATRANYGCIQLQDAELEHSVPMVLTGYKMFDNLEDELGADLHLRRVGGLLVVENEATWKVLEQRQRTLDTLGLHTELIPANRVKELEPGMDTRGVLGALYSTYESQIYPFSLVWAFVQRASEKGLQLLTNTEVTGFIVQSGKCCGVQTTRGDYSSGVTVLSTGAWTPQLGRMIGRDWQKIGHVHGQAAITEKVTDPLRHFVVTASFFEESHAETTGENHEPAEDQAAEHPSIMTLAMAPSPHGHVLLGEFTRITDHFNTHVTSAGPKAISGTVGRYFPSLRSTRVLRSWGASIAFTTDSCPFLGPVESLPGLILSTAFRSTVISTPLAGKTVAQLVTQGRCDLDIRPFLPDR